MRFSRQQWFELIGGLVGLASACAGTALGIATFGHYGVLTLVLSVPAGMGFGWLLVKVLDASHRVLSELDEDR